MKIFTTAAVALMASSAVSYAATFDFATDADNFFTKNGYEGTFDQVYAVGGDADLNGTDGDDAAFAGTAGGNTVGGIEVNAIAALHPAPEGDDTQEPLLLDPFMDSSSNGSDDVAGLGVCRTGLYSTTGISNCSTGFGSSTDDDNLVFPELLALSFSDPVFLTELVIRDAGHDLENGSILAGSDALPDDEGHPGYLTLIVSGGFVQGLGQLGFSDFFYFTSVGSELGQEIYLSSVTVNPIPLPAAGWLLIGGLGGLAAMKRRKKAA